MKSGAGKLIPHFTGTFETSPSKIAKVNCSSQGCKGKIRRCLISHGPEYLFSLNAY
jgi:hypothetical protein